MQVQRVMQAWEGDLVQLFLCPRVPMATVQPVSEMLSQESLQIVTETSLRVRCDMCTAEKLAYPIRSTVHGASEGYSKSLPQQTSWVGIWKSFDAITNKSMVRSLDGVF